MNTASLRELHQNTGALVRAAAKRPLRITDRGQVIAIIQAPDSATQAGAALPDREAWIARLPRQKSDSVDVIGEDRER